MYNLFCERLMIFDSDVAAHEWMGLVFRLSMLGVNKAINMKLKIDFEKQIKRDSQYVI